MGSPGWLLAQAQRERWPAQAARKLRRLLQFQVGELLVHREARLGGVECGLGGLPGRRGFLLRLPFEGVGGKEGGELGQW